MDPRYHPQGLDLKMTKHSGQHKIWGNKVEWHQWAENVLRSCTPPWMKGCFEVYWDYKIYCTSIEQEVGSLCSTRLEDIKRLGNELCTNRKWLVAQQMDLSNADWCTVANGQVVDYLVEFFYQAINKNHTRDIGTCLNRFKDSNILLTEEILHHLGCINPYK